MVSFAFGADFDVGLLHKALPLFGMVMSFLLMWLSSFASFVSAVSAGVLVVSWLSSLSAFTSLFHLVRGIAGFHHLCVGVAVCGGSVGVLI